MVVLAYLQPKWTVSKSTLYRHRAAGRLRPEADGTFSRGEVDRFAKRYLVERGKTGGKAATAPSGIAEELQSERAELVREQRLLIRRKREVEEGKYVLKADVSKDLTARAVALKVSLKQPAASMVSEWIFLVGGDPLRAPELLRKVQDAFEGVLADYAQASAVIVEYSDDHEDSPVVDLAVQG